MSLPRLAISVRQPWAWALLNDKDIENRDWKRGNPGLKFRGPFALHASAGLTQSEYAEAAMFMGSIGINCPPPHELVRGAIIGSAVVASIVPHSDSPWFFGPIGLVITDAKPCDPIPCKGELGFFKWRPSGEPVASPARWMLPDNRRDESPRTVDLFEL